jgi:hypothetical protein
MRTTTHYAGAGVLSNVAAAKQKRNSVENYRESLETFALGHRRAQETIYDRRNMGNVKRHWCRCGQ